MDRIRQLIERGSECIYDGTVTDKEEAIKLLCISPKNWSLLSPELQSDSEVMLYYQPTGHAFAGYTQAQPCEESSWNDVRKIKTVVILHEPEFSFVSVVDLKKLGLVSYSNPNRYFIPKAFASNLPEDFDFEAYLEVRDRLRRHLLDENIARLFIPQFSDMVTCGTYDRPLDWTKIIVYNRAVLPKIVREAMKEKGERKRFTNNDKNGHN